MAKPSRDDPSKPKAHGYAYKKQFYQSSEVAADYDEHRFRTPKRHAAQRAQVERHPEGAGARPTA